MEISEFALCKQAIHLQSGTHDLCLIYLRKCSANGLGPGVFNGLTKQTSTLLSLSAGISINVRLLLAVVDLLGETLKIMAHCCLNYPAVTQKATWEASLLPRMQMAWRGGGPGGGGGLMVPSFPASLSLAQCQLL